MFRHFRFSFSVLALKVAIMVVGVSILTATIFILLAYRSGTQLMTQVQQARADIISNLEEQFIDHLMLERHHEGMQEFLDSSIRLPQLDAAYVLNDTGLVSHSAGIGKRFSQFPLNKFESPKGSERNRYFAAQENGIPYQYILSPISNKPACRECHGDAKAIRGYLVLKIATDDLHRITSDHRSTNIIMTAVLFGGLSIALFGAFHFLVILPVSRLHRHIERMHTEDLSLEEGRHPHIATIEVPHGNDEISNLARSFNDLVERLNASSEALSRLHEQEIDRAGRIASIGEMAGSLAHEIRNPIAGIQGALQIFDSDMPEGDPKKEILKEMLVQADRIVTTKNDLLSYARPAVPRIEIVDMHEQLKKSALLLKQRANGLPHVLSLDIPSTRLDVEADAVMLGQLFWNIMLNGLQAMDNTAGTAGTLTVRTNASDSEVMVQIEDSGNGIPEESLQRIFKPFYTTKHKGTGLGLAISRRIVEQHNGVMDIRSRSGEGTTFTITLPLRQPASGSSPMAKPPDIS